jgi:hypothetical protein
LKYIKCSAETDFGTFDDAGCLSTSGRVSKEMKGLDSLNGSKNDIAN